MTELDADFGAEDELNPFQHNDNDNEPTSTPNFIGPNYIEEEDDDEDDDLNTKPTIPKRIKELDDSDDELDENEKHLQQQFKQNFNNLFANKSNMDENDCVIQEEIESKEYNKEHGEQKMEPFNLREERGEGYFDQFLNYHKTKTEELDPFYIMMDQDKQKNEKIFNKKYNLSAEVIKKHKNDYDKFEKDAHIDIDLLNEWKSLLPLFSNDTDTVTMNMQSLSQIIKRNQYKPPTKKRKLNDGTTNIYQKVKKKKKKAKRSWEIVSDEEHDEHKKNEDRVTERELLRYNRKFEIFSEKSTMLFANGDHNIYEQTRKSLRERIKLVEDGRLFRKQQREIMERRKNYNMKRGKEILEEMLDDFSDDDKGDLGLNEKDLVWEYYWKHDENKEKHGPFSCKQMYEWNELYFKAKPIMFKRMKDTEWLCSTDVDLVVKLQSYVAQSN